MRRLLLLAVALLMGSASTAEALVISFTADPFAGTTALTTPGRQVVGGEPSVSFSVASDVFAFEPSVFGAGNQILFANDVAANLPTSGVNVVVLRDIDNDANSATPFGAGNAASLIAARMTSPGPGFFVYFNSGLDLPRLVYSTDLDDATADLKILARITNLTGQSGALATFTASNFAMIPEPSTLVLVALPGALGVAAHRLCRSTARRRAFPRR